LTPMDKRLRFDNEQFKLFKSNLKEALWGDLKSVGDEQSEVEYHEFEVQIRDQEANMISLPASDEDLLRECEVDTFRSSGPGGQHVNKTESAVRLRHLPSGVVVTAQQQRSHHQNKAICLQKLRKKIERLNYRPAKRVPTRISRSAK